MPIEVELPDGNIAEFPDNTSPDVIKSTLRRQFNIGQEAPSEAPALKSSHTPFVPTPTATPEQSESGLKRNAELGARAGLQGLGGYAGLGAAARIALDPANALTRALGGQNPWETAKSLLQFNPGKNAADALNLAKPETQAENLASAATEGAVSTLPFLLFGGAPAVARSMPNVARFFGAMPKTQVLSGALGGAAGEAARESGAGAGGQMGAALAGGAVPFLVAPFARGGVNQVRNLFGALDRTTDSGQMRAAGDTLRYFATDPEAVVQELEKGVKPILQGSDPTLSQVSGDRGLSILEKGVRNTSTGGQGSDLTERYAQQAAARRDALNSVLDPAKQRIDDSLASAGNELKEVAPGYMRDPQAIGADIRKAYDEEYAAIKAQKNKAYEAIDPDKTSSFDVRPLRQSFADILETSEVREIPPRAKRIVRQMDDAIKNGRNWTFEDLQEARSILSDVANDAALKKQNKAKLIATDLAKAVDNYIENGSMNPELMGGGPIAKPGTQAYKDANAVARQAVDQNSWYNDLAFLVQHGLNREAVEKLGGRAMLEEFDRLQPGLVRRNGTLKPDTVSGDLDSFNALTAETGGGTYFANGDDFLNEVLSRLGSPLGKKRSAQAAIRDNTLQQNTRPHTGFTPEQAEAFKEAKWWRTEQGNRFEKGANEPLSRRGEKQNNVAIDDSAIAANYAKNPEAIKAFMSSVGNRPEARKALNDFLVGKILQKASKDGVIDIDDLRSAQQGFSPILNEMASPSYFPYDMPDLRKAVQNVLTTQERNKAQLDALNSIARRNQAGDWELKQARGRYPDNTTLELNDADRSTLNAVRDDAQRAYEAARRADVAGSPTAQLTRIEKEMDRALRGIPWLRNKNGLIGLLSGLLNSYAGNANADMMRLLNRAMLDPAFALQLMRGANTASRNPLKQFVARPQTTALDTLKATGGPQALNAVRAMMQGIQGTNR